MQSKGRKIQDRKIESIITSLSIRNYTMYTIEYTSVFQSFLSYGENLQSNFGHAVYWWQYLLYKLTRILAEIALLKSKNKLHYILRMK